MERNLISACAFIPVRFKNMTLPAELPVDKYNLAPWENILNLKESTQTKREVKMTVLQIRRGNRDNLGMNSPISS